MFRITSKVVHSTADRGWYVKLKFMCLLFVQCFPKSVYILVSDKPSTLKYIGTSRNRYYAIHEIKLEEILYCTDLKRKIDATVLFKDAKVIPGGNEQKSMAKGLLGKVETKRVVDDPFAGFSQIKKKDSALTFGNQSNSHYPQSVDQVISMRTTYTTSVIVFLRFVVIRLCKHYLTRRTAN